MWKNASIGFASAIIGGLIVYAAVSPLLPKTATEGSSKEPGTTQQPAITVATSSQTLSPEEIYKRLSPSVVHVKSAFTRTSLDFFGFPFRERGRADGSGFVIQGGLIVTNAHVVQDADGRTAPDISVILADKSEIEAKLVGADASTDLALLKLISSDKKLPAVQLGDSQKLEVGDQVYAIGNPFGYDRSMSQGIVSALGRTIEAPNGFTIRNVIQTDAAVNPGNSGGPLIDSYGRVIGVNAQIASQSEDFAGIAFAIPSNTVKRISGQIRSNGQASHAWLGIKGQEITLDLVRFLKLPVKQGIIINSVLPDSPAEKAGLQGGTTNISIGQASYLVGGDILVKIDDTQLTTMDELLTQIDKRKAGDKVTLTIYRGNKRQNIVLALGERPVDINQ